MAAFEDSNLTRKGVDNFLKVAMGYINLTPYELRDKVFEIVRNDYADSTHMTPEEKEDHRRFIVNLILMHWGRARKEEGMSESGIAFDDLVASFEKMRDAAQANVDASQEAITLFQDVGNHMPSKKVKKVL